MERILNHINNHFYLFFENADFEITSGYILVKGKYIVGQYIKIKGSLLNDGVYKVDRIEENKVFINGLVDESFNGTVFQLGIPRDLIKLEEEIKEFNTNNKPTNVTSESFGGYSYSKATGSNGVPLDWTRVFSNSLKPYKRMFDTLNNVIQCIEEDNTVYYKLCTTDGEVLTSNEWKELLTYGNKNK
ncbi:MAG: hypothetical protein ACRDDY_02580 [Clostridium sp.]|uniref:hypothetical protein n=1 Tax=Clostridium sp. TaxID=1506 RepID=UPI003EE429EE